MEFLKYHHIERLGATEVADILEGRCYVFPKIDGTNASVWWDNGLQAGSSNRHLSIDNDNAGFLASTLEAENIKRFLEENQNIRLYGEWLVPNSLRTYRDDAWRKFYVFDVMRDDKFMRYEDYQPLLEAYEIEYIPPIFIVENPKEERLYNALEQNSFLVKDGSGTGEGIVIKNYDFVNKFGRTSWAKIVTSEFKAENAKSFGHSEVKEKAGIEDKIAADFVTLALIEKVHAKIVNETGGWSSRDIPRLLNTVYYDIVREEIWAILKKHKNPKIDFSELMKAVFRGVKFLKPELFS